MKFDLFQLFLLIIYLKYVKSVPDEYCLHPLNRSDCGTPPTPVFSYYKDGSRCEIEFWRGCPSKNMFENQYHCSHYCIGRLKYYGRERGSWKGRVRNSIEDMDLKELEEINRILHDINNPNNSNNTKQRLVHVSPGNQPKLRPTTVRDQEETTVEDSSDKNSDHVNVTTLYTNCSSSSTSKVILVPLQQVTIMPSKNSTKTTTSHVLRDH